MRRFGIFRFESGMAGPPRFHIPAMACDWLRLTPSFYGSRHLLLSRAHLSVRFAGF